MEEMEVLVKVEGLSKKFCKDFKTSLKYGVQDLFSALRGSKKIRSLRDKEFWALRNINFELRRGECLGLIGHNGAGKSTLLKILNGLIKPDEGTVIIKGKVGALIELGAGFNPILTGRENIYNNGAVLGFSRAEINEKLDDIIDFAELREFIDMPVQNYSSGMKVRLGFAVAAQMEPDVLIIDEVLAVGDLGFVLKCLKTVDKILPKTALIFVSHDMPMVSRLCNKILLIEGGIDFFQGKDISKGIDLYYNCFCNITGEVIFTDGSLELDYARVVESGVKKNEIPQINWGDNLELIFKFHVKRTFLESPLFHVIISDKEQKAIAILEANQKEFYMLKADNSFSFKLKSPDIQLSKGIYNVNIVVLSRKTKGPHFRMNNLATFQVIHPEDVWQPFLLRSIFALEREEIKKID